jgi:hypothetical protein
MENQFFLNLVILVNGVYIRLILRKFFMKKKRLLVINPNQFGYAAGYHYYCKYLKDYFEIDFLCFDKGYPKLNENNVNVIYLGFNKNKYKRFFHFLYNAINLS